MSSCTDSDHPSDHELVAVAVAVVAVAVAVAVRYSRNANLVRCPHIWTNRTFLVVVVAVVVVVVVNGVLMTAGIRVGGGR
jgi:uncharacterized membrane protein YidH (DUF202 family)